jgi:hypothetical protein
MALLMACPLRQAGYKHTLILHSRFDEVKGILRAFTRRDWLGHRLGGLKFVVCVSTLLYLTGTRYSLRRGPTSCTLVFSIRADRLSYRLVLNCVGFRVI